MPAKFSRMPAERIAERLRQGMWVRCTFDELREGDIFKLYEPDMTLVFHGIAEENAHAQGIGAKALDGHLADNG